MSSGASGVGNASGKTIAALAVGASVVVGGVIYIFGPQGSGRDADPGAVVTVAAPMDDATATETPEDTTPEVVDTAEETPEIEAPRFDQIRVAPDGSTVIAGQAEAGSDIRFLLDGAEVAATRSSNAGDFAAIFMLEPSSAPRIMSLMATTPDGTEIAGAETVIIAPFGVVEDTAEADTAEDAVEEDANEPAQAEVSPADEDSQEVSEDVAEAGSQDPEAPTDDAASVAEDTTETETTELAEAEPVIEAAETVEAAVEELAQEVAEVGTAVEDTVAEAAEDATVLEDVAADTPTTQPVEDTAAEDVANAADEGDAAPEPDTTPTDIEEVAEEAAPQAPEVAEAAAEPEAPAIVVASPEGVRVVQGADAAPEVQTEVRIDAITYNTEGDVALSGRGPSDRQVQVLLNNQPIQLGEIGPQGQWSLELPDVDPGTYTLTVEQLSPSGEVESRTETPFLREDPELIAGSPMRVDSGVSVITVQPGFTLWGIAEANFGDGIAYVQIFQENRDRIRNPDLIFPGQIFELPDLPRTATDQ